MLKVVQAFDRAPIAEVVTDATAPLEAKLKAAERVFRDRDGWLKPHRRIAILRKLAGLMAEKRDHLAMQIVCEGGKPLSDAIVETNRSIDGVHNAADGFVRLPALSCRNVAALAERGQLRWRAHSA